MDIAGMTQVVRRLGATPGDGLYEAAYDVVYDRVIDLADVQEVAGDWRVGCP